MTRLQKVFICVIFITIAVMGIVHRENNFGLEIWQTLKIDSAENKIEKYTNLVHKAERIEQTTPREVQAISAECLQYFSIGEKQYEFPCNVEDIEYEKLYVNNITANLVQYHLLYNRIPFCSVIVTKEGTVIGITADDIAEENRDFAPEIVIGNITNGRLLDDYYYQWDLVKEGLTHLSWEFDKYMLNVVEYHNGRKLKGLVSLYYNDADLFKYINRNDKLYFTTNIIGIETKADIDGMENVLELPEEIEYSLINSDALGTNMISEHKSVMEFLYNKNVTGSRMEIIDIVEENGYYIITGSIERNNMYYMVTLVWIEGYTLKEALVVNVTPTMN